MKTISYLFIILLMINLVNAISVEDFNLAKDYSNSNNCSATIQILEGNCIDLSMNKYQEAQCHFVLGYCYDQEWLNRNIIVKEDGEGMVIFGPNENIILINKSIEHYNQAINISWCNLTDKDLRASNKSGFLTSSLFFNADNYLTLKDYGNAEKMLTTLNTILSLAPNSANLKRMKGIYDKLYSAIPKKVEVELKGDLNPIFYSQPEIKPEIIMGSKEDPDFKLLHVEYQNLNGFNEENIQSIDSQFVLNKKLLLNKKNSLLFPFDSFYAEVYNIQPNRIQNKSIQISIIGESSNIEGIAQFEKDRIKLNFKRKLSYSIQILLSFMILFAGLIFFNKKIKYMKKTSFQPNNLIKDWSFDLSLVSLIFFITRGLNSIFNLLSIIILITLIVIILRFYKKKKKVFSP